jgi:hypothetical protein
LESGHAINEGGAVVDKAIMGLAEAIEALRSELLVAMDAGAKEPVRFVVDRSS